MNPISKTEYVEKNVRVMARSYEAHRIVRADELGWTLRRPDSGCLWARVLVTADRVIVIGDGPDMILRHAESSPVDAICWLASSDLDYLGTKVLAGEARQWNEEVALDELLCLERDLKEERKAACERSDGNEDEETWQDEEDEEDWISSATRALYRSNRRDFIESISDRERMNMGEVPSIALIQVRLVAQAIVREMKRCFEEES